MFLGEAARPVRKGLQGNFRGADRSCFFVLVVQRLVVDDDISRADTGPMCSSSHRATPLATASSFR
jgi:hypothetical protein